MWKINEGGVYMSEKILAVFPHPDDETFGKAGTLIKHVEAGDDVTLICATMGQMGRRMGKPNFANRETMPDIRKKELEDACNVIGIQDVRMWMMQDKTLQFRDKHYLADKILQVIDEVNPTILYSFYPQHGVHPDHDSLAIAASIALSRMPENERPVFYGSAFSKNHLEVLGEADVVNDVSDVLDAKMEAMRAHRSQSELITLPLEEKIKKEPSKKDEFMKSYTKEKFWIYPIHQVSTQ